MFSLQQDDKDGLEFKFYPAGYFSFLLKINLNKNPIFAKNWAPKVGETH